MISDVNECLLPNACGGNTDCANSPGDYSCSCTDGYELANGATDPKIDDCSG